MARKAKAKARATRTNVTRARGTAKARTSLLTRARVRRATGARRSATGASARGICRSIAISRRRTREKRGKDRASAFTAEVKGSPGGVAEASNFAVESQLRTKRLGLLARLPLETVSGENRLVALMVRHCGWLLTRLQMKAVGRTAFC